MDLRARMNISPRSFMMGKDEPPLPMEVAGVDWCVNGDSDEHTVHKVTISRPFSMPIYEVTNDQLAQVMIRLG